MSGTSTLTLSGGIEFDGFTFTVFDSITADGNTIDFDGALTLDSTTSTAGTDLYYRLSSTEPTYAAVTKLYVAYYSAVDCPTSDYVGED